MPLPAIAGAAGSSFLGPAIGAIGSLVGGLFGGRSQRKANEENARLQREFAQHGISWRVEDAKRAGLHPLFALGGGGATFTPSSQPVMDGQNLSRAAAAAADFVNNRELVAAQLESVKASTAKDYALAAAAESEAARLNQSLNTRGRVEMGAITAWPDDAAWGVMHGYAPGDNPRPFEPPRSAPVPGPRYLTGPREPGLSPFEFATGPLLLPSPKASESMESLESPALQAFIAVQNVKHFGPGAAHTFEQFVLSRGFPFYQSTKDAIRKWLESGRR